MTRQFAERLEGQLQNKLDELNRKLGRSRDLIIERSPDISDEAQAEDIESAGIHDNDRVWRLRRDVLRALDRVRDGELGVCEECGEAIPKRRMEAVPWATLCVPCQTALEANPPGNFEDGWQNAA